MTDKTNATDTFLSLVIDKEYFAVNVEKVLEVLQMQKINRIPNVSNDIKGVTNFRGEIIPVFDIRVRFALPQRDENEKYVIVVLEINSEENRTIVGAMVDKVKDVFSINEKDILPVPKLNTRMDEEFISGVYRLKDDFIILLDVNKMFADGEMPLISEIAADSI